MFRAGTLLASAEASNCRLPIAEEMLVAVTLQAFVWEGRDSKDLGRVLLNTTITHINTLCSKVSVVYETY
jgi:hypothetical protein